MTALSAREHACMALIAAFDLVEKRSPTLTEISRVLRLKHKRTAEQLVGRLVRRGLLDRDGPRMKSSRSGGLQISQVKSPQENINAA